jgi:hypothetical protein
LGVIGFTGTSLEDSTDQLRLFPFLVFGFVGKPLGETLPQLPLQNFPAPLYALRIHFYSRAARYVPFLTATSLDEKAPGSSGLPAKMEIKYLVPIAGMVWVFMHLATNVRVQPTGLD